jgi:hypothetical protein
MKDQCVDLTVGTQVGELLEVEEPHRQLWIFHKNSKRSTKSAVSSQTVAGKVVDFLCTVWRSGQL